MPEERDTNRPDTENEKPREQEKYSFIQEKIKDKPVDKRKLLITLGIVAVAAVLFGLVAALVFCWAQPKLDQKMNPEIPDTVSFPDDDAVSGEEAKETEEASQDAGEETQDPEEPVIIQEKVGLEIDDYTELYKKLSQFAADFQKSLVTVTASTEQVDWYDNLLEDRSQGSGAVIADNGLEYLVLTQLDLVQDAKSIQITFSDGSFAEGFEKAYDSNTGIAVISVNKSSVPEESRSAITIAGLGNSNLLKGGTPVFAVGSPSSYQGETLIGHVASTGNVIHTIDANYKLLTTDIIGSESGSGFLVNLSGEIVGIIAPKFRNEGASDAVIALPISDLKSLIEKLSNGGQIAYMGIKGVDVTAQSEESSGIPLGVYVQVEMDSPAMTAGIQNGDIITALNNQPITSMKEIQAFLLDYDPDQAVNVSVMRQGRDEYTEIKYVVTLGHL